MKICQNTRNKLCSNENEYYTTCNICQLDKDTIYVYNLSEGICISQAFCKAFVEYI